MKNDTIKLLLIFTPALFGSFPALANVSGGDWKPQIVEKMFVLPPQHLNKVLNNDFKISHKRTVLINPRFYLIIISFFNFS